MRYKNVENLKYVYMFKEMVFKIFGTLLEFLKYFKHNICVVVNILHILLWNLCYYWCY